MAGVDALSEREIIDLEATELVEHFEEGASPIVHSGPKPARFNRAVLERISVDRHRERHPRTSGPVIWPSIDPAMPAPLR